MSFSFIEQKGSIINDKYDIVFYSDNEVDYFELDIKDKKYCFQGYSVKYCFEKEEVVFINMWRSIALFSTKNGSLLYFSGLNESFVGVEELEGNFLVLTDTTLFLINKNDYYPWAYKTFIDHIQDYEVNREDYKVTLKFAVDNDLTVELNRI